MIVDAKSLFEQSKLNTRAYLVHAAELLRELNLDETEIDDCLRIAEISSRDFQMTMHSRDSSVICSILENIAESLEEISEKLEKIDTKSEVAE